jgi:CSLREA domain-containing protein
VHLLSDLRPDDFGFRISDFGLEENLSPSAIRHPPSAMAAVLPMRLNVDALDDLVILREESTAPAVVMTAPMATFTVNSTLDAPDSTPGDGTCCTGFVLGNCLGVCTLRAAIQEANASPGTDAIVFNIIGAGPHTIQPTSPLPTITDPVTLDGTTDPDGGGMINLNGSQAGVAHGLVISAGSSVVRGLAISGFHLLFTDPDGGTGIRITTAGSNIIEGNHIGPDAAGAPVGNLGNGIEIIDSPNNLIGGATAAARNVISLNGFFSFTHGGLFISGGSAGGNRVQGNYIGVGPTGAAAMPNNEDGVHISGAPNNTIGGTSPGARNVISGNEEGDPFFDCGVGVVIVETSGTLVQGNYIGTDADGEAALGNGADGVFVGSPSNTIGGTTPSARNVISGNRLAGVEIHGLGASINRVQGNYIGINADGSAALGNGHGVYLLAANNTIGGTAAGAGNVISGNGLNGVTIAGSTVSDNRVEGNYIGTDPTGSAALGNGAHGVAIGVFVGGVGTIGAPDNIIGGTDPQAGNIISGNALNGVEIGGGSSTGNVVQGNYIGTDKNGVSALKNHHNGVLITSGASENTIGGTDSGAGNTIAFNGTIGVFVQSSASTGNAILGNAIFSNTGLGIDLWPGGVTFNELGDADTGANNLQNFPTIDWISNSGGLTTVNLDLHSLANTMFRIEVFAVAACDLQGHGEGQTFLAAATVTTNGTGEASFTTSFPTPAGQFFTATATNLNTNDTSEFSACAQACRMTCPTNIDKTTGPGQCGTTVNYPALTTGACGGVVCTPPSGAFFSKGVTTVTCNTSTGLGCSFTVTVSDHQDPTVSCPANITQPAAPNQCGATVNFSAGFADNCPGVTGSCSPPPSAFFPVGVTTVVCTATDAAGRRASCSFTVTVTNTPPTANAGTDQKAVEGKTVTLNSSGSRDPEGQTLASQWTQTGGPPVTLNNAQTATPSFTAPLVPDGACQSLVFQLTVTDPCGLGATDTVVITISDGYLLLDDRSGSCLELFTCDHTYEFYDGSTRYSGPAIITATSARVAFQSAADGPNYLTGTIDLTTRRGSARYQVPRGGSTIKSIFDSNIDNNPAACP